MSNTVTEREYDQIIDSVDPDDILYLGELTTDHEFKSKLYELHDESKIILDYFGAPEYSEEAVVNLAQFVQNINELHDVYTDRLEFNNELASALKRFVDLAPPSLWEVNSQSQEDLNE